MFKEPMKRKRKPTVEDAKRMKKGLLKQLERYKGCKTQDDYAHKGGGCPICRVSSYCYDCPWLLLGNKGSCLQVNYEKDSIPKRRRRIRRWIRRCDVIIERGE